ncbi:MAG: tetratricopeptide repeat protein [Thermodesulfobacteriota bacterium]
MGSKTKCGMIFNRKHFLTLLIFALFSLLSSVSAHEKNRVLSYHDYIHRAKSHLFKGQPNKAIEDCGRAIDLNPRDPTAYYVRGHCYNVKVQYEKAIGDMKTGIALDPKGYTMNGILSKIHCRYGNLLKRKGQYDKAIEQYSAAIALNPRAPLPYAGRGYAYILKGSLQSAIADLQKACDLGEKDGCRILEVLKGNVTPERVSDRRGNPDVQ